MNSFIIDCYTRDVKKNMHRLENLKSTHEVSNGGMYREDHSLSQIHLISDMNEKQLDQWFYKTAGVECIGVCLKEETE